MISVRLKMKRWVAVLSQQRFPEGMSRSRSGREAAAIVTLAADPLEQLTVDEGDLASVFLEASKTPRAYGLSLQGNLLTRGALHALSSHLLTSHPITSLNLAMCSLGDDACVEILRSVAMSRSQSLKELDLSMNGLSAASISTLR